MYTFPNKIISPCELWAICNSYFNLFFSFATTYCTIRFRNNLFLFIDSIWKYWPAIVMVSDLLFSSNLLSFLFNCLFFGTALTPPPLQFVEFLQSSKHWSSCFPVLTLTYNSQKYWHSSPEETEILSNLPHLKTKTSRAAIWTHVAWRQT